jgi:hypothetical protein
MNGRVAARLGFDRLSPNGLGCSLDGLGLGTSGLGLGPNGL